MIRFFRQIRQRLLTESRFSKYLLYAVGEIFLVVIGILIALSINNWNEFRKERKQEQKVLTELITSLEQNYSRMISDSINRSNWNRSSDIVIHSLEQGIAYSDTMNTHFQDARKPGTNLSLSYSGYESLKNIGYNIITSDTLRKNIVEVIWDIKQDEIIGKGQFVEGDSLNKYSNVPKEI